MTNVDKTARTPTEYPHIEKDYKGRPVIAGTRMRVSMIVRSANGIYSRTPEQIVTDHPGVLSLKQVYLALAYYQDHRDEIENEIKESDRFIDEMERIHADPEFDRETLARAAAKGL